MKNFFKLYGPALWLILGTASVTVGAGMIYLPAGFIVGGFFLILWWVLDSLSGGEAK